MDRLGSHSRAPRPVGPAAATILTAPTAGALVTFTFDAGDGTVCRGPWVGRTPAAGDSAVVIEDDAGTLWAVGTWPG